MPKKDSSVTGPSVLSSPSGMPALCGAWCPHEEEVIHVVNLDWTLTPRRRRIHSKASLNTLKMDSTDARLNGS